MKTSFVNKAVGILGGGQLARMMIIRGHELGLQMHVMSSNKTDPAAQVCQNWQKGDTSSGSDLKTFLNKVDVATFESEFINGKLLQDICRKNNFHVYPRPFLMDQLQDRLSQKKLLEKYGLPTANFLDFKAPLEWPELLKAFPKGVVFKKRRFGYDGYGTFMVKSEKAYQKFLQMWTQQNLDGELENNGYIVESYVPFRQELALVCARNKSGKFISFPMSETFQKDSKCFWVKGPVKHRDQVQITRKLRQLLNSINYVGVFATELFDTGRSLLVNEIAPRVHNSGHHSQNSMQTDQFTYHLLCLLNTQLPEPKLIAKSYSMVNLIGATEKTPRWEIPSDVNLHWYGKSDNRSGRKMGHLNALDSSPNKALAKALKALKEFSL